MPTHAGLIFISILHVAASLQDLHHRTFEDELTLSVYFDGPLQQGVVMGHPVFWSSPLIKHVQ